MGQFKPMVKMETTEPSVILKLKKGGKVRLKKEISDYGHKYMNAKHKFDGGAMGALAATPALIGRPAVNAPVAAPGRPGMAARRMAMMAKKPMPSAMMKKGGMADAKEDMKSDKAQDKAMIAKAFKQHDSQEHKGDTGTKLKLKKGGKMATGGITCGQGGYKDGGIIKTKDQGGEFRNTKVVDAEKGDHSPADTKGVKLGNGGGYKTGGVAKANGGGYKNGGMPAKKHFATGGAVNNSGHAVAMKQNPPVKPVRLTELTGTYKKGGKVAHKAGGGNMGNTDKLTNAYNGHYSREGAENAADSKAVDDALMYLPRKAMQGLDYLKNKFTSGQGATSDAERAAMQQIQSKGVGAISDREREAMTTVVPARRRGGAMKK